MPCSDNGEADGWADHLGLMRDDERRKIERAALCGIMRAAENSEAIRRALFHAVDWAQSGVTPDDVARWYNDHRKREEARA